MRTNIKYFASIISIVISNILIIACLKTQTSEYRMGEYGYDLQFLNKHTKIIELVSDKSRIIISPEYQGRVMTSTSKGFNGLSNGWINYKHIEKSIIDEYANPYGGEERIWLGPEAGEFSVFFTDKNYAEWKVPSAFDRESFNVDSTSIRSIHLSKKFDLTNSAGTNFKGIIKRTISICDENDISKDLNLNNVNNINVVAYKSENIIKNTGKNEWDKTNGALSIWMLSMLPANDSTIVIIPIKQNINGEVRDYLQNLNKERLLSIDQNVLFKVDGKLKSKIGISPDLVKPIFASYNPSKSILTVIKFSLADASSEYVNSSFEKEADPYDGDVINVYNDGPEEGDEQIGLLYELETSSPAAFLKPNQSITHSQNIYHIESDEKQMNLLLIQLFGISLSEVETAF